MIVLGIESTCDETAAALVEDGRVEKAERTSGERGRTQNGDFCTKRPVGG